MRPGIPSQLVGGPRSADPCEDGPARLERPRGLLTEPPYRARLREATRVDWRFLLGLAPGDVVLAGGAGGSRLARSLAPWVHAVHRLEPRASAADTVDWVFFSGTIAPEDPDDGRGVLTQLRGALESLRPGGHVAITLENRWGLHWLADWRVTDDTTANERSGHGVDRHGLRWHRRLLREAGAEEIRSYALLPSRDAPRAIIPVDPPCPAAAQRMALDQVWQRATPAAAVVRRLLGVLVQTGLMRRLYPHYLVVGRKPC